MVDGQQLYLQEKILEKPFINEDKLTATYKLLFSEHQSFFDVLANIRCLLRCKPQQFYHIHSNGSVHTDQYAEKTMDQIEQYFGRPNKSFEILDKTNGDFLITHHNEQV